MTDYALLVLALDPLAVFAPAGRGRRAATLLSTNVSDLLTLSSPTLNTVLGCVVIFLIVAGHQLKP